MATKQTERYLTPNEIRIMGIKALARELGPVGMARFFQQFDSGEGDYTKERKALLAGTTMEDMERQLATLREKKTKATPSPRKAKATVKTTATRRKASKHLAHA